MQANRLNAESKTQVEHKATPTLLPRTFTPWVLQEYLKCEKDSKDSTSRLLDDYSVQ